MNTTLEGLQWEQDHGYHALENAADRIDTLKQKNEKLLSALMSMTYQYLSGYTLVEQNNLFSHDFMSAGEETLSLLVELGIMTQVNPAYYKLVEKEKK